MTFLPLGGGATIPHRYLTRHAGIFGATGTGKTTTLGAIAERAPCPVLILDAKGDLESLGDTLLRPTVALDDMGADLIARALNLSEAQAGALQIALAWADDTGRLVVTLQDLRLVMVEALEYDLTAAYGLMSPVSVAAVQRALLRLQRGAPWAFGESPHDPRDTAGITVYAASELASVPGLYGAVVAAILDSLYRGLGEVGDVAAPGLLVMIDEAHLVFDGATPSIVRRIEQIVRLIRSKGVGLIFVTQSPADLPATVAGQLATRVQHALRGATVQHQKALRAAAETMPGSVTAADIMGLATGHAIVSVPNADGAPLPGRTIAVQRGKRPLHSVGLPAPIACAVALPRAAHEPETVDTVAPEARKTRPWWYWPAVVIAVFYGPILLERLL